jgi:uncharacterized protein YcbK (DUF882 family)
MAAPSLALGHSAAGTRSLRLTGVNTGDTVDVVYKRNGRFVHEGVKHLNWAMRDWRNGKQKQIDPRLFDTLYMLQQDFGVHDRGLHLISGYRSPETNAMLRSRSSGVAKNSLHLRAMASDIRIPGVSVRDLSYQARKYNRGGVGSYTSSNFVHVDTGPVRTWGS